MVFIRVEEVAEKNLNNDCNVKLKVSEELKHVSIKAFVI